MEPWGRLGTSWATLGRQVGSKTLPGRSGTKAANRKVDFWTENVAPRVDFGTPLDPERAPKSAFLAKNRNKVEEKSIQEGFQKKHENLIGKSMKNL